MIEATEVAATRASVAFTRVCTFLTFVCMHHENLHVMPVIFDLIEMADCGIEREYQKLDVICLEAASGSYMHICAIIRIRNLRNSYTIT